MLFSRRQSYLHNPDTSPVTLNCLKLQQNTLQTALLGVSKKRWQSYGGVQPLLKNRI